MIEAPHFPPVGEAIVRSSVRRKEHRTESGRDPQVTALDVIA